MADEFQDSRTEAATPRRREEAREQGQVAVSQDLYASALLLVGLAALAMAGRHVSGGLLAEVRTGLAECAVRDLDVGQAGGRLGAMMGRGAEHVGLVLAVLFVAALGVGLMQVGFHVAPNLAEPKPERLAQGWSKLFSSATLMRTLGTILKLTAAGATAWWMLRGRIGGILALEDPTAATWVGRAAAVAIEFAFGLAATLLVVGVLDYAQQKWRHEKSLMMTKEELKEEMKRDDGNPQVKARLRKLQRDRARKMMFREIPKASVVVTNPTHLAIALRYESGMRAPLVVAKGADFVAKRIVETARKHGVVVLERKPLARSLYKSVQLGQEIPVSLYFAVSEVINYVYSLKRGRGRAA